MKDSKAARVSASLKQEKKEKLRCGSCGKVLATNHSEGKKNITIKCPKCKKTNKY